MERTINYKKNLLLYPFQNLMGFIVHSFFLAIMHILPEKYSNKIKILESNPIFLNIAGLTFFNSLGGFVVMLTNVKIANVVGASLYGLYSYYLAIGEVGHNFVRYGLNKTMTRDLIQKPNDFAHLISNALALGIINTIVFLVVTLAFKDYLDIEFSITAILLILAPCIGSLDFQNVYESLKQMSWHSIYLLIQRVVFLVAIWAYIITCGSPSLLYLAVTLFVSWFFILVLEYKEIVIGFCISIYKEVSWRNIWELYKSNFVIAISCMTGVAFGPIIRVILNSYADSKTVGVYSAGMQIFLISQFLMHQVSRVGNPMMAEAGKSDVSPQEKKKLCNKYFLIMLISVLPFTIPILFFPHEITSICFTEEYQELGYYLPYFAIYLLALSLGIVYTQFLISMRQDRIYFIIYISSAVLTIIASLLLIPAYSLLGAVLALCIPHSIGCLFYYLCSIKYLKG